MLHGALQQPQQPRDRHLRVDAVQRPVQHRAPVQQALDVAPGLLDATRPGGTQDLSLQHQYRAMDFLEANKEPIARVIFHRLADLPNLDVEVLFYATTSFHFEIDPHRPWQTGLTAPR